MGRDTQFGPDHSKISLCLREWLEEVIDRPQYEFRCFVHDLKLNAITQYFDWLHFPELVQRKQELQDLMTSFFYEHVAPVAPYRSFVIDFYVSASNQVMIIEFNPFHNGAGAGLFSWSKDRELFLNGPLEFRIVPELPSDQLDIIPARWNRWIDSQVYNLAPSSSPAPSIEGHEEESWFSQCSTL